MEKNYDEDAADEMMLKAFIFIAISMAVIRLILLVIGIIYDSIQASEIVINIPDFRILLGQWAIMSISLCAPCYLGHIQEKKEALLKK